MAMGELKRKIAANRRDIVEVIRYDDIRDYLRQELFSLNDDEQVMAMNTNRDKMRRCLDLLEIRGPQAYDVFMKAIGDEYDFMRIQILQTELPPPEQKANAVLTRCAEDEITPNVMIKLSRQYVVMREWMMFARLLGLDDGDIFEIETEYGRRPSECVYQTMTKWKAHCHLGTAKMAVVYEALTKLGVAPDVVID